MWQAQEALSTDAIPANGRRSHADSMITRLPQMYYDNTNRPIVIDKCRAWTLEANMAMLRKYVSPTPKVIVMTRPIAEIERSFRNLFDRNGRADYETGGFQTELERNILGVADALADASSGSYHFVEYADLVADPQVILDGIYDFLELPRFAHQFTDIVNPNQENDLVHGLVGMHDVRPILGILA